MKYFILILISNAIKCKGSCGFDNKTIQLFWEQRFSLSNFYPLHNFLNYQKIKRKLESNLKLNHPNVECDINEICNTKFSYFEKMDEASLDSLDDIDYLENDTELDLESYSGYYYDTQDLGYKGCYSFCEMFFMFEHKTKFVFLVDHFELWLFSHRNFTIHSNQLTKKSGNSFFTTR